MKRHLTPRIIFTWAFALCLLLLPAVGHTGSSWTKTFLCRENTVTITRDAAGTYHFQSTGRIQVERLSGGGMIQTKGVPVYHFKDGDRQYRLWDGSENNPPYGSLEVYDMNKLALQLECARQALQ